jgi:beta-glucosidase
LAELLFADARGQARYDFQGRLPFAWPMDADQFSFAHKKPLFPLGFGLSLGEKSKLPRLHERSVVAAVDPHTLFNLGAAQGGWTLTLEDAGGAQKASGPAFRSPNQALHARAVDLGLQEGAIALAWNGAESAALVFRHPAVDLTRDVNAACCIALTCVVQQVPRGPFTVRLHAGPDKSWGVDVALDTNGGETTLVEVPLKAFGANADFAHVDAISLETGNACEIVVAKVAIAPMAAGRDVAARR